MKIGTITFHGALNFGSALQSYALQEVLKGMGHEVRIIDYRSRDYEQYRFFQPRHPKMTLRAMRCWRKQSSRKAAFAEFSKSISGLQRDRISGKKKVICTNSLSSLIVLFAEAIKFGISIAHKVLLAPISFHLPEIVDELLTLPVLLTLSLDRRILMSNLYPIYFQGLIFCLFARRRRFRYFSHLSIRLSTLF